MLFCCKPLTPSSCTRSFPSPLRIPDIHIAQRQRSKAPRAAKRLGKQLRGPKTVLASWCSAQSRASSSCQTRKESEQHIAAAARTAQYLLAVSESKQLWSKVSVFHFASWSSRSHFRKLPSLQLSGRAADLRELTGAESLSHDFGSYFP